MYLVSIAVGVLVGVLYALLHVRSPAPPAVALLGLLGMLVGEQIVPIAKRLIDGQPLSQAWFVSECAPHITGVTPKPPVAAATPAATAATPPTDRTS
jgi:XapX domain-containing protein